MWNAQHLAYISNVGASLWGRPIFTTGALLTACTLAVALISERWMRHMGRLLHVSNRSMTALSVVIAILLVSGSGCLIFLTIFDVRGRPLIHYPLVSVFVYVYTVHIVCLTSSHRIQLRIHHRRWSDVHRAQDTQHPLSEKQNLTTFLSS